jgi:hypothetical protein
MQMGPLFEKRAEYRWDFVDSVAPAGVRGDPDVVAACCKSVAAAQRQLWKLRWDNHYKEVYWQLVVNGLTTTERMHMQDCGCVCGPVVGGPPGRHHHFWECFVAQAVAAQLQHQITGWYPGALQPQHVLCMLSPGAGVPGARPLHEGVWRVVCLSAINAMDVGRSAAAKARVEQREQAALDAARQQLPAVPVDQQLITQLLQPATLTDSQRQHHEQVQQRRQAQAQLVQQQRQQLAAAKLEALKRQAVARFWELLQDFVVLRVAPASWLTQLAPDHPFLRVHGDRLAAHCVPPSLPGG